MLYYDKINHGDVSLDTKLVYKSSDYEAGTGDTSATYKFGDSTSASLIVSIISLLISTLSSAICVFSSFIVGSNILIYQVAVFQNAK